MGRQGHLIVHRIKHVLCWVFVKIEDCKVVGSSCIWVNRVCGIYIYVCVCVCVCTVAIDMTVQKKCRSEQHCIITSLVIRGVLTINMAHEM